MEVAAPARRVEEFEESALRPWWRPTLPVVVAFSGGLWIGATLSFADTASAAALLVGVAGLALGGARLLSNRIREGRIREARERRQAAEADEALEAEVPAAAEEADSVSKVAD